jgi:hypothetical protein
METGLLKGESFNAFEVGFLEYLLVVSPDAAVYDKVMQEKQNFDIEYAEKIAIKSKPQITIASFLARERNGRNYYQMDSTHLRTNEWV